MKEYTDMGLPKNLLEAVKRAKKYDDDTSEMIIRDFIAHRFQVSILRFNDHHDLKSELFKLYHEIIRKG